MTRKKIEWWQSEESLPSATGVISTKINRYIEMCILSLGLFHLVRCTLSYQSFLTSNLKNGSYVSLDFSNFPPSLSISEVYHRQASVTHSAGWCYHIIKSSLVGKFLNWRALECTKQHSSLFSLLYVFASPYSRLILGK